MNISKTYKYCIVVFFILFLWIICSGGCSKRKVDEVILESKIVFDVAGTANIQTPVQCDTQGNLFGYFEYLPSNFEKTELFPLIFYWNGANALSGNGREDLTSLLDQGLPELINNGEKFPAIIISAQLENWKTVNVKPFVDYIMQRYKENIDSSRIYMTGFSAGGGITIRFAAESPEYLSAIVPIAPAARLPGWFSPSSEMCKLPSWIFHNTGDDVVTPEISKKWHAALQECGDVHRLTLYQASGHYAWQAAYADPDVWDWLFKQVKVADK